jgi:hypothetical protein
VFGSQQLGQLVEQVEFELAGNRLSHVLAELPSANALLDSGREILGHRHAHLAGWADHPQRRQVGGGKGLKSPPGGLLELWQSQGISECALVMEDRLQSSERAGPLRQCSSRTKFADLLNHLMETFGLILRLDRFRAHNHMLPLVVNTGAGGSTGTSHR